MLKSQSRFHVVESQRPLIIDKRESRSIVSLMPHFVIEFEQEEDARWIAEIPTLPGVLCYGISRGEAKRQVEVLALCFL